MFVANGCSSSFVPGRIELVRREGREEGEKWKSRLLSVCHLTVGKAIQLHLWQGRKQFTIGQNRSLYWFFRALGRGREKREDKFLPIAPVANVRPFPFRHLFLLEKKTWFHFSQFKSYFCQMIFVLMILPSHPPSLTQANRLISIIRPSNSTEYWRLKMTISLCKMWLRKTQTLKSKEDVISDDFK